MRTTVVTGIAGSLGRRVSELLVASSDTGRIIGVDSQPEPRLGAGVEYHRIDLAGSSIGGEEPSEQLASVFDGADTVVHLAWQTADRLNSAGMPEPGGGPHDANRLALSRVLAAASRAGVSTLVHLSSATVYGAWADNRVPLTEDVAIRPNPEFGFAVGKAEAERVVADWAHSHPEVAVSVLRPTVMVGSPERPLYNALGATRVPAAAEDGGRPVQYLHVEDLASAVLLAARRQLRGVYNVAPDSGIRESLARSLAGGLATVTLPSRIVGPLVSLGWDLWRRGIPREALAYATHPWAIAPDRLKAEGWEPQYTSEQALVVTDERPHFDDLPPGRRQNVTMLLAAGGVASGVAAGVGGLVYFRSRRRS